jgi:hypothetical protein
MKFQDFLDALSTKGGNILAMLVIFFMFLPVLGVLVWLSVLKHLDIGQIGTVLISTFAAYSGALLAILSGNSSRQQMLDRKADAPAVSSPESSLPGPSQSAARP